MPSGRTRTYVRVDLDRPLATAEFLVVDTETNGLAGDACELTEIGAVLVGGGELHDRWETLLSVRRPLSRGIQRFTGISQAMVDEAPPAEAMLPELAEQLKGRVLVAHSAAFDRRVLIQAFARAGIPWPSPPSLCTVALARRFHPLARQRRLQPLAESLGIDVEVTHRALADAETCARVFCALFGRLCANAATIRDALALLRPARPRRPRATNTDGGAARVRGARRRLPDLGGLTDEPGVYVVRNAEGQALYVGKSVSVRSRARAHFVPSAAEGAWAAQAETVEHEVTSSELGALVLESRLVKRLRPPGNVRLKHVDNYVYLRCRLDIAFPVLEVAPGPAPGHGGERRAAARPRARRRAARAAQLAVRAAPLRAQAQAAAVAVGVRADGPLPVAVPRRPRPEPLPPPPRRGARALHRPRRRRRRAAAPTSTARCARPPRPSASSAPPGCGAAASASPSCSSASAASSRPATRGRASCSPSTRGAGASTPSGSSAAASSTGARSATSTTSARARPPRCARGDGTGATTSLAPDEVDDARIVATWLAEPRRGDARSRTRAPAPRRSSASSRGRAS